MNNEKENKEQKGKEKRLLLLLLLLLLITIIAVAISIWAIWFREKAPVLAPDYAPKETETNAKPIGDEGDDKLEQPEGGGAVSLTYAKQVNMSISKKKRIRVWQIVIKISMILLIFLFLAIYRMVRQFILTQSSKMRMGSQYQNILSYTSMVFLISQTIHAELKKAAGKDLMY